MTIRPAARAVRALTIAAASLLAAVTFATPARAATTNYAALGDSYSAGVGTNNYYSSSGSCDRSPQSYAALWAANHAVTTFAFVACSGATTTDVLNNQLTALNSSTTLVSITIGGNDAGFADVVTTCTLSSDSGCDSAVANAKTYATTTLPAKLDQTYAAIRSHAPNARLIVLGYPRLFELTSSCGFFGMSLHKRTSLDAGADVLTSVIAARAGATGATFVDARAPFAGHGVCAGSPWINELTWPISDSYHPKASGYLNAYLPALTKVTG